MGATDGIENVNAGFREDLKTRFVVDVVFSDLVEPGACELVTLIDFGGRGCGGCSSLGRTYCMPHQHVYERAVDWGDNYRSSQLENGRVEDMVGLVLGWLVVEGGEITLREGELCHILISDPLLL